MEDIHDKIVQFCKKKHISFEVASQYFIFGKYDMEEIVWIYGMLRRYCDSDNVVLLKHDGMIVSFNDGGFSNSDIDGNCFGCHKPVKDNYCPSFSEERMLEMDKKIDELLDEYSNDDVVIGEMFWSFMFGEYSLEDIVDLYGQLSWEIDGNMLAIMSEDGDRYIGTPWEGEEDFPEEIGICRFCGQKL